MSKLTDSQLVILSAAAQREDGSVLPLSKSVKLNKGAATLVLKSLLRQGLVAERPAAAEDEVWRETDGKRLTLAITEAGLTAIGARPEEAAPKGKPPKAAPAAKKTARAAPSSVPEKAKPGAQEARAGTKQGKLLELLRRKTGATIEDLVGATGWQPHSVRGAISGLIKKKLGLAVTSDVIEGRGRVYRVGASAK
jgi:DNA-binding MarR family transcriptional regulator